MKWVKGVERKQKGIFTSHNDAANKKNLENVTRGVGFFWGGGVYAVV